MQIALSYQKLARVPRLAIAISSNRTKTGIPGLKQIHKLVYYYFKYFDFSLL